MMSDKAAETLAQAMYTLSKSIDDLTFQIETNETPFDLIEVLKDLTNAVEEKS